MRKSHHPRSRVRRHLTAPPLNAGAAAQGGVAAAGGRGERRHQLPHGERACGGGGGENAAKGAKTKTADDDDDADEKPEEEEEEDKEGAEEAAGPVDTSVYRGEVFVEFARVETATVAAHRFHRRLFDGRSVKIEYFPIAEYQRAFAKGVPPRTHEELQAAAIKAQEIVANLRSHGR